MRVEVNIETGEAIEVPATAYVVGGNPVLIDDGDPVPPGATLASSAPPPPAPPVVDPVNKLKAFLEANPDVLAAVQAKA